MEPAWSVRSRQEVGLIYGWQLPSNPVVRVPEEGGRCWALQAMEQWMSPTMCEPKSRAVQELWGLSSVFILPKVAAEAFMKLAEPSWGALGPPFPLVVGRFLAIICLLV